MKMEQIECSETSAYINETPGNHPKENTQNSEHGESLKSRISCTCLCITKLNKGEVFPGYAMRAERGSEV